MLAIASIFLSSVKESQTFPLEIQNFLMSSFVRLSTALCQPFESIRDVVICSKNLGFIRLFYPGPLSVLALFKFRYPR